MDWEEFRCPECGGMTYEDKVKMSLWEDERLVIIENVPVQICKECKEHYYEQAVRLHIEMFRSKGFPIEEATRIVETPVFSLPEIEKPEETDEDGDLSEWQDPAKLIGMY
jgi:YgiT-type zinc finger domain-containing protein